MHRLDREVSVQITGDSPSRVRTSVKKFGVDSEGKREAFLPSANTMRLSGFSVCRSKRFARTPGHWETKNASTREKSGHVSAQVMLHHNAGHDCCRCGGRKTEPLHDGI